MDVRPQVDQRGGCRGAGTGGVGPPCKQRGLAVGLAVPCAAGRVSQAGASGGLPCCPRQEEGLRRAVLRCGPGGATGHRLRPPGAWSQARPAPAVAEGPVLLESPSRCLGRGLCPSVCCPHWCAGAPAEQTVPVPEDVSPVPGRRAGEVEEKHGSQLPQVRARLSLRGPGCTRCRRAGPAPGPWRDRSHERSSG